MQCVRPGVRTVRAIVLAAVAVATGTLLPLLVGAQSAPPDSQRSPPPDSARPLPAVKVEAKRAPLDRRMEQARSLGGVLISEDKIRKAAPTSRNLGDLMRRTAGARVTVVSGYGGATCLLILRTANLQQQQTCAMLVVDEVMSGGDAFIAPTDVELVVIVPPSAATVRYGERARYGAVVVYTRAGRGDGVPPAS
jgi:hypothetical protein